jgi:hypothetical protein
MISKLSACAGLEVFGLQASIGPSIPAERVPGMGAGEPHGREVQKNCGQSLGYSPKFVCAALNRHRPPGVPALKLLAMLVHLIVHKRVNASPAWYRPWMSGNGKPARQRRHFNLKDDRRCFISTPMEW